MSDHDLSAMIPRTAYRELQAEVDRWKRLYTEEAKSTQRVSQMLQGEIEQVKAERDLLRKLLLDLFNNTSPYVHPRVPGSYQCKYCSATEAEGHNPDCFFEYVQQVLKDTDA